MRNLAKEDPKFFWLTIGLPFLGAASLHALNEIAIRNSDSEDCLVYPGQFLRPYLLLMLLFFPGVLAFNSVDIQHLLKPKTGYQFLKPWAKFYMLLAMLNQTLMPVPFLVVIILFYSRCDQITMFSQIFYWSCFGLHTILAIFLGLLLSVAHGSLVPIMVQHNKSLLQRWRNSRRMKVLRIRLSRCQSPTRGASESVVADCQELCAMLGTNRWYGQWLCDFQMNLHFFTFLCNQEDKELLKASFIDPKCLFCDETFSLGDRLAFNPLCGHLLHYICSVSDIETYSCPCPLNSCRQYGAKALELIEDGKFIRGVDDIKDKIKGLPRLLKH